MLQFFETLTDDSGNSLLGATVTVSNFPANTLASIFNTNGTASPIAGATVISDITGQVSFFVPDGAYTLTYAFKGTVYKVRSPVQLLDPMGFVFATDTGAANAYVVTSSAYPSTLYVGLKIQVKIANPNTGNSTFNLNSTGNQPLLLPGGTQLPPGVLIATGLYNFEWDGAEWQLLAAQSPPFYQQTAAEITAGVVPVAPFNAPLNVLRYGADPTGTADSTTAFQNAINVAQVAGGSVYVPSTTASYRLTSTLSITAGCRIYGDGYTPYVGAPAADRGPGSWLQFAHLNVGINCANGATGLSSVFLELIGTFRNQPVLGAGWAPIGASYDIAIANADIHIRDVLLLNPTNGVLINNQVGARTFIDGLFGQPLTNGINVQLAEDTLRINNVHFWPYWENDSSFVNPWTLANLVALTLARCDDPEISNFFSIFALNPIQFNFNTAVTPQITSRALISNAVLDQVGAAGVTVVTGANGVSFALNNVVGVPFNLTSASTMGVLFSATNAIAQISNCRFSSLGSSAVSVSGSGNNVKINSLVCDGYNGANNASACVFSGAGNSVVIGDPINATATNAAPVISNPGLISYNKTVSGALQFASPAVTAVITHNLGYTPLQSQLSVTFDSAPTAPQSFWWSAIGSMTATLNMSAVSAATVFGQWTIDARNTV